MNNNKHDAWSMYWQSANIHSCLASAGSQDQKLIELQWSSFAKNLDNEDRILDLATGNGAVPFALLSKNPELNIDAVDAADIYPMRERHTSGLMQGVHFFGNTDILNLNASTFTKDQYSALTSQFGVEYAGMSKVLRACANLLTSNGKLKWIVHHKHSELVKSSEKTLLELDHLLADGSLINAIVQWSLGNIDHVALEAKGRENIEQCPHRSQRISGQVFDGVIKIGDLINRDRQRAIELAKVMQTRMNAEKDRLEQLLEAAQSETDILAFKTLLSDLGFDKISANEVVLEPQGYLLAWDIEAEKK